MILIIYVLINNFLKRKALQAGAVPQNAEEQRLLRKTVGHYEAKHEKRKETRRQMQETHEKRVKRRDAYQQDVNERREKRDNQVYYDGINYTIKWTCMPRYVLYLLKIRVSQIWSWTE